MNYRGTTLFYPHLPERNFGAGLARMAAAQTPPRGSRSVFRRPTPRCLTPPGNSLYGFGTRTPLRSQPNLKLRYHSIRRWMLSSSEIRFLKDLIPSRIDDRKRRINKVKERCETTGGQKQTKSKGTSKDKIRQRQRQRRCGKSRTVFVCFIEVSFLLSSPGQGDRHSSRDSWHSRRRRRSYRRADSVRCARR